MSKYAIIVPWIDGWKLLEETSKKVVTASHCANLSPQISWQAHIMFSRLVGASLIIVPDPLFDRKFNLKIALETAKKEVKGMNTTRIILSGGINPERISVLYYKR